MSWDETIATLREEMDGKHASRETALKANRAIIQTCSKCIKHIHRNQIAEAEALLSDAKAMARQARMEVTDHPEVLYAGYLQDAEKELVEAAGCLAIVKGDELPSADELEVGARSYLNGMGECASEMRRTLLDLMRGGEVKRAETMLKQMEMIYDDLSTFDYPDGLTGGLRRTCDALRAVIERTRSDLTMTTIQQNLMNELRRSGK